MTNNETIAKIATAKAVDDKTFKQLSSELPEGVITLDKTIRLVGGIKKGPDYTQRMAAAANPWKIAALALSKLNAATIESIVRESLEVDDETASAVKAQADEALQRIKDATERRCSGKITSTIQWELLS